MPVNFDLLDAKIALNVHDWIRRWWQIDILVVTDTIVSFGPEHNPNNLNESNFGMSHLIGVLEGVGAVTKAHRSTDPLGAAGIIANFTFDNHDLSVYDQIWLIGWDSGSLPEAEHDALCKFMNNGGGVFATGDHAALGSALAGSLPRVRSMRRWNSPPPPLGPTRVDTTVPDHHGVVVFENQSDDIPQKLQLKWYPWNEFVFARQVYPHPLL